MLFSVNTILITFSVAGLTSSTPVPTNVYSRQATIYRSQQETYLHVRAPKKVMNDRMQKRAPADSPLSGLLGTVSVSLGSLPIVGGPLSGLVNTVAGTTESLPLVGDLLKSLPVDSLLNGHPISNLANTLSGVVVALPVVGQPLSGALTSVAGIASSPPISLVDAQRAVVPSQISSIPGAVSSLPPTLLDTQRSIVPSQIGQVQSVVNSLPVTLPSTQRAVLPSQINSIPGVISSPVVQATNAVVTPQN